MTHTDAPEPDPFTACDSAPETEGRSGFRASPLVLLGPALATALLLWVLVPREADGEPRVEASSARHVERPVIYGQNPPSSGDHHPVWWDCGVYEAAIPTEHAVHSLEHGAVWLTYHPDAPADEVRQLRTLADLDYILLSPNPAQPQPVMATAWNQQIGQITLDLPALKEFVRVHRKSPQAPEPGALCTNGTTTDLVERD